MNTTISYFIVKNNIEVALEDVKKIKQAHQDTNDALVIEVKIMEKEAISSVLGALVQSSVVES